MYTSLMSSSCHPILLLVVVCIVNLFIYIFHTQSTHIDKSYINSNTIIHRINDKYIIMPVHITVNKI